MRAKNQKGTGNFFLDVLQSYNININLPNFIVIYVLVIPYSQILKLLNNFVYLLFFFFFSFKYKIFIKYILSIYRSFSLFKQILMTSKQLIFHL